MLKKYTLYFLSEMGIHSATCFVHLTKKHFSVIDAEKGTYAYVYDVANRPVKLTYGGVYAD